MPEWAEDDVPEEYESASGGGPAGQPNHHRINDQTLSRPYYERLCQRSLLLSNLAEGTTHGDITEAVRGGQLLDIYVRPHDRMATVAFLQAADARAFFDHVRRHDLYIKHKRVRMRVSVPLLRILDLTQGRSTSAGMIGNSFYPVMLLARLALVPLATLSSAAAIPV